MVWRELPRDLVYSLLTHMTLIEQEEKLLRAEAYALGSLGFEAIREERNRINEMIQELQPGARIISTKVVRERARPDGRSEVQVRLEQKKRAIDQQRILEQPQPEITTPEQQQDREDRQEWFRNFEMFARNAFAGLHKKQ